LSFDEYTKVYEIGGIFMKILNFRLFKRLTDEELIQKIHESFKELSVEDKYYKEKLIYCDALIKEAKIRNLCCSKELLYGQIIYKKNRLS
jgi:hypothetical protein